MHHWLYERILEIDGDRSPTFSVRATYNWFKALSCQIKISHGETYEEQIESCRKFYREIELSRARELPPLGKVFEALFFSMTSCMSLERISSNLGLVPWIRPTSVIDWYYAVYFSIHSMLPWVLPETPNEHSRTANLVASSFRHFLLSPFDMVAEREAGENYKIHLNGNENNFYDLNRGFICVQEVSQGMLAQYLKGTANWYVQRAKDRILADRKTEFKNFRTKKAQILRDKQLISEVGFLHCAYRQRLKANYRDSIYLVYDHGEEVDLTAFAESLSSSAKFVSIMALAFIEKKTKGRDIMQSFVNDLDKNLRGIEIATSSEKYWEKFR